MKIKYILAAAVMLVAATGCSDYLDQDNRSNVTAPSFDNASEGFESLTNSMYSSLRAMYNITGVHLNTLTLGFAY